MHLQPGVRIRTISLSTASWILLALVRTSLRIAAIPRPFGIAVLIFGQVLAASALWLVWAPGVVALAERLQWRTGQRLRTVAIHLAVASAITVAEAAWGWLVLPLVGYPMSLSPGVWYLVRLDQTCFLYLCLVGLGLGLRYRSRLDAALVRAASLNAELLQARLHVLALELHPHFLFNTLNAVSELVHRDAAAARRMLSSLRELLARSLDAGTAQEVPLREELALLEPYARIQRTRFAGSLRIDVEAAPETLDASVPRLVLQPLVENAIRHGTARRMGAGRVIVRSVAAGGRLILEVVDDGVGLSDRRGPEGLGLANTRARLAHLFEGDASLVLEPAGGSGAVARIECPLRPSSRHAASPWQDAPAAEGEDAAPVSTTRLMLLLAGAWVSIAIVGAHEDYFAALLAGDPQSFSEAFRPRLGEAALWLALSPAVIWAASRIARTMISWPAALAAHLGAGLLAVTTHSLLVEALVTPGMQGSLLATLLLGNASVYAALAAGGHAWTVRGATAERNAASVGLEAELMAARLELLRWQLRPELLFGALDRIGHLSDTDSERADELTGHLGDLLRLMLQSGRSEVATLDRELQLVSAYCEVRGALCGDCEHIEVRMDPGVSRALVPPMTLLPMIEIVGDNDGHLMISGTTRGYTLTLAVRATRSAEREREPSGNELQQRMEAIYGNAARLGVSRSQDEITITLRIPLSFAPARRAVA
jgi:two-component system LytT family sensor kinase